MTAKPAHLKPVANHPGHSRNAGMPLDLSLIDSLHMNFSAIEQRTATLPGRRSVKKDWQAAWLLKAITCMDLTTLSGDDTDERVRRLCAKGRQPIQSELVKHLGVEDLNIQ